MRHFILAAAVTLLATCTSLSGLEVRVTADVAAQNLHVAVALDGAAPRDLALQQRSVNPGGGDSVLLQLPARTFTLHVTATATTANGCALAGAITQTIDGTKLPAPLALPLTGDCAAPTDAGVTDAGVVDASNFDFAANGVYLSDLVMFTNGAQITQNTNYPPQRDKSVGGNTLTIGGTTYAKGIGVQASSDIYVTAPAGVSQFTALAGIDDEEPDGNCPDAANASVTMFVDSVAASPAPGTQLTAPTTNRPTQSFTIAIAAGHALRIHIDSNGSDSCDHVDVVSAKFSQ